MVRFEESFEEAKSRVEGILAELGMQFTGGVVQQ